MLYTEHIVCRYVNINRTFSCFFLFLVELEFGFIGTRVSNRFGSYINMAVFARNTHLYTIKCELVNLM